MAEQEDEHWWFVGRRHVLRRLLARNLKNKARAPLLLDAGSGTGGNLPLLAEFGNVHAFEYDAGARQSARAKWTGDILFGEMPDRIPFEEKSFDLITMFDVLEHVERDSDSLRSLSHRLAEGGRILLTVPAMPWLWSRHDELHHHQRRYTAASLREAAKKAGLEVVELSYFNTLLFPLAVAQRMMERIFHTHAETDMMPHPVVNAALASVFGLERWIVGNVSLPFGLSLYASLRKS
ncbi:class I SAM-dependent methyltransferase [Sphingosinicella microcystinivorans]|nr:class I SAM-dependent methyltransferase [Sphingosinicella microcystinivorans]